MKTRKSMLKVLEGRVSEMTRMLNLTKGGIYGISDFEYYWNAERYDRTRR